MAVKDVKFILSFDDKGTAILKKATSEGVKTLGKFQGKAKDAEKALKGFATQSGKTGSGMSKLKGMLKSTWGQVAIGVGVIGTLATQFRFVGRALGSVVTVGREFQRSWANTTTMMETTGQTIDDTGQSLTDMKNELIHMSPLLGGAKGLSDGLYQVLSASIPVGESLDFLAVASKSAQAGVTDISTSVDALTTVYNAYGAEVYSANEISDIMFTTVKRGKLTYESLSGALGTIVPIASQVGVSFEEVAGAMASMTKQGIDVNTSTVALRQTLVSVLKPTKDAEETAKRLGIEFSQAGIEADGFAVWLQKMSEAVDGDIEATTALFGNVRALMGVLALAGDKMDVYVEDVEKMREAVTLGTATHDAFVKQLQNADAMLRILKTILDKLKLSIWEGMVKPFQEAILETKDVTKYMEELQEKAIEFGLRVGQSIGNVIKFIVDFRKTIVTVVKVLATLWALKRVDKWASGMALAIVKVNAQFGIFSKTMIGQGPIMVKAFRIIKLAVAGLGKALLSLAANPIGAIIMAVAALGLGAYMLIKHWDKVKTFFVNMWTNIKAVFAGALNAITGLLPDWAKKLIYWFTYPYRQALKIMKPILKLIIQAVGWLGKQIVERIKGYVQAFIDLFVGAFNIVKDMFGALKKLIQKAQFWKKFKEDFKEGYDYVKNGAKATTVVVSEETKKWAKHFLESGEGAKLASQMFGGLINTVKKYIPSGNSMLESLDAQTKALAKMVDQGKISNNEALKQLAILQSKYVDAGLEIPDSIEAIAKAIDDSHQKTVEASAEWREFVDKIKSSVPDMIKIAEGTKGLEQAMAELVAQGGDSTDILQLFKGSIEQLYVEALRANELFGDKIPKSLQTWHDQLDTSRGKTEVLRSAIGDTNKLLALVPGTLKDVARGFMGTDLQGNKVWLSMERVRATAKGLGLVFKQDLRAQIGALEQGFKDVVATTDVTEASQVRLIQTIVGLYKQLGEDVPEEWEDMMKELASSTKKGTKDLTDEFEKLGQLIDILGSEVGGGLGSIISTVGLGIQQAVQSVKNGVKGFSKILGSIAPMLGKLGGQIGSFISGTKDNFASLGASIGSTIGGMFGPLGKAIGSLVGGLFGGLFKKKLPPKTEEQRLLEQFNAQMDEAKASFKELGDISDATARAIAESRKEFEGWVAEAINFDKVMKDVGITQGNINTLWGKAHGILSAYENGLVDIATASEALESQFNMLLASAQEFGLEGSKAMVDFMEHAKASGLEIGAITKYINDQLGLVPKSAMNASEGLQAMADMLPMDRFQKWSDKQKDILKQMEDIGDKGSDAYLALQTELDGVNEKLENVTKNATKQLQNLESQAMSVFNAMIANGASYSEAMRAIGPTLDQIILAHEEMGIEAGAAIQELLRIREVEQAHQKLWNAIDGNLAVLNALAATGSLTQEAMMDAGQKAKNYYKNLMKAGLDSNQALAQMAPTLQQLKYYAEEHGLEIDKGTQALIDQAEAAGLLEEQQMSSTDIMLAGFGLIIQALGADIPEAMQESIDKMNDLEHAVHGSGVTGAMEVLETVSDTTFSKMNSQADALTGKFGTMEGGVYDIQTALDSLEAPDLTVDVDYNLSEEGTNNNSGSGKRTGAQGGYDGLIREPTQPFLAHKGEYVKVWRKDEVARGEHEGGGGAGNIVVQIEPLIIPREHETVVNFVVKKIERGEVRVPPGQVR